MHIYYISPSIMPSRSANSIHVIRMCEAFNKLGHQVTLFVIRSTCENNYELKQNIEKYYGVDIKNVSIISMESKWKFALNLRLGIWAFVQVLISCFLNKNKFLILSRNLYAAYFLSIMFSNRLVFETHQLEFGFRKKLQKRLIKSKNIMTVVISNALHRILAKHQNISSFKHMILHDAAPDGIDRIDFSRRQSVREEIAPNLNWAAYEAAVGYFGHLYPGRGIEIIYDLANRHSECLFLIYGGNQDDIEARRASNHLDNLKIMGYIAPSIVYKAMGMMDILLMPYQRQVSIGVGKHDTARWMSPMKMFEYMAVGVPIISSRLPVLEEVLHDNENCLMADPDDLEKWSACIKKLVSDVNFAKQLAESARIIYKNEFTWISRARRLSEQVST